VKTTLDLPDDLMREMKIRAASQGRKLKDVLAETIRLGLFPETPREETKPTITSHPALGHLLVTGRPNAPASAMTIEELLQLEQDALSQEDLQRLGLPL
jgi:plasmid stability protein